MTGDAGRAVLDAALRHKDVLVAYSGGKDSLAVMDLCVRHFRRVVGLHMYFVPGLAVVEERLDFARRRWGVEFFLTPHWMLSGLFRDGVYCFPVRDLPKVNLPQVHAHARERTGVSLIAHGGKKADGLWRRRQMGNGKDADLLYPIAGWNKWDVLAYLKAHGIDAPEKFDVGLSTDCLLDLHEHHPEDFRRVCEVFPHAEAVIWRMKWYGKGRERRLVQNRGTAQKRA